MNLSEQFDRSVDEFFTYPVMSPIAEPYNENVAIDFQVWQEQVRSDSLSGYISAAPRFTVSRSPSLPLDAVDSPVLVSPLLESSSHRGLKFRLTWPGEGQHQSRGEHAKKSIVSVPHVRAHSITSITSADETMPADPHHEGSCSKCKLTEAEARKCRLERRREQNRASQRKFRARKEAKIREAATQVATLETYVEFLEKHNGNLETTNTDLRHQITELEKTQQTYPDIPTRPTPNEDLIGVSRISASAFPTSTRTATTNAISEAQRPALDFYLPYSIMS